MNPTFVIESTLTNPQDIPPPFKFAILCSGFLLGHPSYRSLYRPKIKTPTMHFVSAYDPVILENLTLQLAGRCRKTKIVYHPESHFVPKGQLARKVVLEFVLKNVARDV